MDCQLCFDTHMLSKVVKGLISAVILDQLLTFLMVLSTLILKPSLSQTLSLHSPLSLAQAHLLKFDHSVFDSHWWW